MKILNSSQIKEADKCSIKHQQISSWELMERAAGVFTEELLKHIHTSQEVHIFCGKGNNGGDGLVAARKLIEAGFNVKVIVIQHTTNATEDFKLNLEKLKEIKNAEIVFLENKQQLSTLQLNNFDVCIDALLGSGVNKPIGGILKAVVEFVNNHYKNIFSIDVPSGLFLDVPNSQEDSVVRANYTFTFQLPKLSFFFPENAKYVGNWKILDIGLSKECIEQHNTNFFTIDDELIRSIFLPRKNTGLKWDYGHCLVLAGSEQMRGAAVLCVGGALKSGCGLVSIHSIEKVLTQVISKYPECVLSIDHSEKYCGELPDLNKYNAVAFGCGIGIQSSTMELLKMLTTNVTHQKLVIDADGLNLLTQKIELLDKLPPNQVIITPHIKEFDRMFGKFEHHYQRIQKGIEIAKEKKICIVLKSAYTAVILSSGKVYFNPVANSGLAKGGSGDVLTGIIAGLCAKEYSVENASLLGVYLHSLAGQFAIKHIHPESVLPSDIIEYISDAFKYVSHV